MSDERRRIEELEKGIKKCGEYKKKIERFSSRLSKDYKKGKIGHAKYEESIQRHLQGIDPEQWMDYYEGKSRELGNEMKKIASSGADAYNNNTRTVAIFGFILFMLVGMLVGNYAKITGFASLENADVYAGKDVYNVGDMVHIFVVPGDAERTVEVYDSNNNLIAVSEDFPAEKPGTYTIKAHLNFGNLTKDVTAAFSVMNPQEEQEQNEEEQTSETEETPPETQETPEIPEILSGTEVQSAPNVEDSLNDNEGAVVGKKIEDEKDYETLFTFIGRSGDYFLIVFYHNSTTAQPVWVEAEAEMLYNLSTLAAQPDENVTLAIPLDNQSSLPKFRLHVGIESEVFEFDINGISGEENIGTGGYAPEASGLGSPDYAGSGKVIDKEIQFSKADMVEESALDENKNQIAVTRIEKDGLSIKIRGAGKDKIKNVQFSNRILHVDSITIKDAKISIPHEPITGLMIAPVLYVKEDNEAEFRIAEPYTKDGKTFNEIKMTSTNYEFDVEHFTDYMINTTGGFLTLPACLKYINNSANTCIINQSGYYDINKWNINSTDADFSKANVTLALDFDDGSSPVQDLSDSNNDGIVYGNVNYTTGYYGNATTFDGAGDFINFTDKDNLIGYNYTWALWFKMNEITGGEIHDLFGKYKISAPQNGIYVVANYPASKDITVLSSSGTYFTLKKSNYIDAVNTWVFLTITSNGTGMSLYKNGVEVNSSSQFINFAANNAHFCIGYGCHGFTNLQRYFNGSIDQVRIYNRTLSQREIEQLYAGDVARYNITPSGVNPVIKISSVNTTINCNDSVIRGNDAGVGVSVEADNSTVQNCDLRNFTYGIAVSSNFSNITGNSIWYSAIYDLNLTNKSSFTNIWLNSFYSKGVNETNFTNIFCVGDIGNFYGESVPVALIGNGTGANGTSIGGDCGLTNVTYPNGGESIVKGTAVNVTWKNQSSRKNVSYYIYYSSDSGSAWNFLDRSKDLNYTWNTTGLIGTAFKVKAIPFDDYFNATNDTSESTFSIFCTACMVNSSGGDYTTIESCLDAINNTAHSCVINMGNFSETFSAKKYYNFSGGTTLNFNSMDNVTIDFQWSEITKGTELSSIFVHTNAGNNAIKNAKVIGSATAFTTSGTDTSGTNIIFDNITTINCENGIQFLSSIVANVTINNSFINCTGENINTGHYMNVLNTKSYGGSIILTYSPNLIDNVIFGEGSTLELGVANNAVIQNSYITSPFVYISVPYTFYFGNTTFFNNTFYGITSDDAARNIRDNVSFINNTFENCGNLSYTDEYPASYSPFAFGGNDYTGFVRFYSADYGTYAEVSSNDTDASAVATGTNNFDVWLCSAGGNYYTLLVDSAEAGGCTAACGSFGLACDYEGSNDYTANGAGNSYTWVGTATVAGGYATPPYLNYNQRTNYHAVPINASGSTNTNITGNTFINSSTPVIINGTDINLWLNNFYGYKAPINYSSYSACFNSEGNFYEESLIPLLGDCGQNNITYPANGANLSKEVNTTTNVSWIKQSSQKSLNYSIYLVNSSGRFYINRTSSLSTIINFSQLIGGSYTLQVAPFDGYKNGTNRNISINISQIFANVINMTVSNIPTQIVNETELINPEQNLTIRFNATNVGGSISTVWIIIWQTVKSAGTVMWQGLMSLIGELWQVEVPVNASYPKYVNYTVFVNDTMNGTTQVEGNFTVNTAPALTSVMLNATSTSNTTNDNLTANPSGASDADGDSVVLNYNWYKNEVSDTVLNMPFTAPDSLNRTYDFSGYANHGTIYGATWNRTGGYDGFGAYQFDGVDDYVNSTDIDTPKNMTAMAWFNSNLADSALHYIINKQGSSTSGWWMRINTLDKIECMFKTTNSGMRGSASSFTKKQWYHVACTWNGTNSQMYINGMMVNYSNPAVASQQTTGNNLDVRIGVYSTSLLYWFNGTIDEVRIYNRSLSANEISLLYSNRTNITHSDATAAGDNWTVKATPIDSLGLNGSGYFSNGLVINTPPTNVSLDQPNNGNATWFNRTPFFNWTAATDADGDPINYTINITQDLCPDIVVSGINGTNYTAAYDLCVDSLYNWTVTAFDGREYSTVSNASNFTIASSVILTMTANASAFGNVEINHEYNTSNPGATTNPLVVQNDGNVFADINVSANESLWQSVGLNTDYFQFKANNLTTEADSFNWTLSTTTWTNIPNISILNATAIKSLNYTDKNDTAEIDIRIKVPADEPSGFRHSTMIITGAMSG